MMKDWNLLTMIAVILLIVGGLNWGLVGLFKLNIVEALFGDMLSRIIYVIVGAAACYKIYCMLFCKKTA